MAKYNFYMQKADINGQPSGSVKNIQEDFPGLKYILCDGLSDIGEVKNIYTEEYAESDGLRVYHPSDRGFTVAHAATDVELVVAFTGDDRRDVYESFVSFIESGRTLYWDNARNRQVLLLFNASSEPEEDTLKGGDKYIKVSFKFKNVWGISRKV